MSWIDDETKFVLKLIIGIVLVIVLIVSACETVNVTGSPGKGQKSGQIVKVNRQGMIWDTWEAQLIRGGMNNGSGGFGTQPFDFTIESDELAEECTRFMKTGEEVIVDYRIEGISWSTRSDNGGIFLTGIRPAKEPVDKVLHPN